MSDIYGIVGSNIQYVGVSLPGGILMSEARPTNDYIAQEDGTWVFDTEAATTKIRAKRDTLLTACDWRMLSDQSTVAAWVTYRQELRDITDQDGFPINVTWPTEPES